MFACLGAYTQKDRSVLPTSSHVTCRSHPQPHNPAGGEELLGLWGQPLARIAEEETPHKRKSVLL